MGLHADTIFALSSGRGRAGVAVVRVSGTAAAVALRTLAGPELPCARVADLRKIAGSDGQPIDDGLVLWFPSPASFTGEDVVEFHIHGGRAVVEALLAALASIPTLRPAEAGEFTRRAVENGKFDLTRAEALADLINAETEAQRRQALRQYDGALQKLYDGWRTALIRAAAWIEAAIDFSDEEIPEGAIAQARSDVAGIVEEIRAHLADQRRGEILRDGFHLTVVGPPNSGKSSLINALARRDVAIVADTAGLRETGDRVEAEGVRRALARAEAADAVLLLLDATAPKADLPELAYPPALTVWNKVDVAAAPAGAVGISVRSGEGLQALLDIIRNIVRTRLQAGEVPALTTQRHRSALSDAVQALGSVLSSAEPEIAAEEMRRGMRAIGRITGAVDVEDLLDVVFRDFCIGK
jgi:tRNA modification GTPase